MIASLIVGFTILGYVVGFAHARFSDYALRTKMWPYNKTESTVANPQGSPYREPAKVPFMVTQDQHQQLADLGYSKAQRTAMKPAEVQDVIKEQKGPKILRGPAKNFRTECMQCNSKFEYTFKDTKQGITIRTVQCPSCGHACMHSGHHAI